MKSLFRNPIWLVVLFSIIGLIALLFIKDAENGMGFFLSCVGIGLSAAVVECSIRQNKIEKDNIRIQMFDKRYNVYTKLLDTITIIQRDNWDRYILLNENENDINKQMIFIEEELYKSVYLSECLFDKAVYKKLIEINHAFCGVARAYKNMVVSNVSNLKSPEEVNDFFSLLGTCVLSDSLTAVEEYNEALKKNFPKTYISMMEFSKEANAYVNFVLECGVLDDIKKYILVNRLDS